MAKWFWQLKWALVIAIVAGPAFAYFSFNEKQRVERIMEQGVELPAIVESVEVQQRRRRADTYTLHLQWIDSQGAPHAQSVEITSGFANSIIVGDTVALDQTPIRFLEGEEKPFVVAADAPFQIENQTTSMWLGIGAGIAGLIFAPLIFWFERRRAKQDADETDAMLARMRADGPR